MKVKTFISTLSPDGKRDFAARAGTTVAHLIQLAGGHRQPSPDMAKRLAKASGGAIKLHDLRPDIWTRPRGPAAAKAAD